MKKPILLIAPGLGLFLIGTLMLVALTGFRLPPSNEAEARIASANQPQPIAALVTAPRPDQIPAVTAAVRSVPDVAGVAEVKSGTRWLAGWDAEGTPQAVPPAGYLMPVDVGAVDFEQYRSVIPESLHPMFSQLPTGGAVLSRTGAALRGITDKGHLQFPGASIPVVGVVDDIFVRNHEVLVSLGTGVALGLHQTEYVVIGLNRLEAGKQVEDAIRAAIPGSSIRVRGPQGSGVSTGLSPLLSLGQIKAHFGEFPAIHGAGGSIQIEQSWIDANTEIATFPILGTTRCHKKLVPQMRAAFAEVEAAGLSGLIRPGDFGGCFSPRFIRSGNDAGLSRHAWGAAFDFNVSSNLYGEVPTMDRRVVEIMERNGFSWGGHWNYPDGMHFEFVSAP
jgi:hypothetical protein